MTGIQNPLFTATDLQALPGVSGVTETSATMAERIVWGWLRPILAVEQRPNPVSDELFSWALELGAIAHENPTGMSSYQLGAERVGYSTERRVEILAEVADGGRPGHTTGGVPRGRFPQAPTYPDPARW